MTETKPTVMVAVPALEYVHTEFAICLAMLMHECRATVIGLNAMFCAYLCHSRKTLAEDAIKIGASHIFMLDSDVLVQPTVLDALLKHDKDIVAGTYTKKRPPQLIAGTPAISPIDWTKKIFPFQHIPLGCALIKTDVFRKMRQPWFSESNARVFGEDMTFCDEAIAQGFEIWVDLEVTKQIGHIGSKVFTLEDAVGEVHADNFMKAAE